MNAISKSGSLAAAMATTKPAKAKKTSAEFVDELEAFGKRKFVDVVKRTLLVPEGANPQEAAADAAGRALADISKSLAIHSKVAGAPESPVQVALGLWRARYGRAQETLEEFDDERLEEICNLLERAKTCAVLPMELRLENRARDLVAQIRLLDAERSALESSGWPLPALDWLRSCVSAADEWEPPRTFPVLNDRRRLMFVADQSDFWPRASREPLGPRALAVLSFALRVITDRSPGSVEAELAREERAFGALIRRHASWRIRSFEPLQDDETDL